MSAELRKEYESRFRSVLVPVAAQLQAVLLGYLKGTPRIDRVSVRAKYPDSFMKKAFKVKNGVPAYSDPLGEIQDQIGARVIAFYTSDIDPISKCILKYFRHIEAANKEPLSEAEFGYFGRHYILAVPPDAVPPQIDMREAPTVFELQVRTLFQHAWSEAEHDLAYKPQRELTSDEKRKFAFTAAQAWGADRIFQDLYDGLSSQQ